MAAEFENDWFLCPPEDIEVHYLLGNSYRLPSVPAPVAEKTLVFAEGLMAPVVFDNKDVTLRKYRSEEAHGLKKGEIFVGSFKDGLDIALRAKKETEVKPFSALTDRDARGSGFRNAKDAFEGMGRYYPDLGQNSELAVVRFKLATEDGLAKVRVNNYLEDEPYY